MKRNLLAIAIPALLVAGAANASIEVWNKDGNKLNVNGRVYALNYVGKHDNTVDGNGDKTTARIGFTGETQVTDWLSGYGRFEWETATGSDASNETRYAFAGLNFGQYGSFDYGRNDGVLKALTAYTDVLPEFGGDASNNSLYLLSARTSAVATYRNNGFYGLVDGLDFAVQYGDNKDINSVETTGSDEKGLNGGKEAYGFNAQYAILDTGLSVGAGYTQTSGSDDNKAWSTGLKYDAYNLYLAGLYIEGQQKTAMGSQVISQALATKDKVKVKGFELVAQYGIDFEVGRLTPSLAYVQHQSKDAADAISGSSKYLAKYVEVGMQYDFNKNLTAIVDYKINLLDSDDIGAQGKNGNTKDTVALGLIYQF
ncbi:outer membrane protein N [Orbus hercynius]|uniref:Outer membrane protein N n=1 Tax=Orbus hercynius TaxID=593135 RepID=A0A495RBD6_9GAMM|nr:porin [Orbus hercynius]RKS84709.1 outer membrane protein N [Orbus hercynius]